MSRVTIVDYGVGNLKSVARAFEFAGAQVNVTSNAQDIENADRLILPGVGAFGSCMEELTRRDLTQPILNFTQKQKPFMGICVGMQIMLSIGEEFGEHKGLGLIPGRVKHMPQTGADGKPHTLPYIGWAELKLPKHRQDWIGTPLAKTIPSSSVYFLHSYAAIPDDPSAVLAQYHYDGQAVTAAIIKDHLTGMQFHPEKSAQAGITIIQQFLAL